MARRIVLALSLLALPLLLIVLGSGPAQANPILPGTVTCAPAAGGWTGHIKFVPPLRNGGTATGEVMTVKAKLGSTTNPCATSAGSPQLGAIKGAMKFTGPGANNCATVFSGVARTPVPASQFKLTWSSPLGAPTIWKKPPPFAVTGAVAMSQIAITGGSVSGSFSPFLTPSATLSDANWTAVIPAACSTTAGLSSLTLATSVGSW